MHEVGLRAADSRRRTARATEREFFQGFRKGSKREVRKFLLSPDKCASPREKV
jgi:hypothetical protein